jgi:hypothetical protein
MPSPIAAARSSPAVACRMMSERKASVMISISRMQMRPK